MPGTKFWNESPTPQAAALSFLSSSTKWPTPSSEIQDELRSQYALSYKPADFRADGRYHTIEILAQNHKGLQVRSRRGYYAPAQ